MKINKSDLLSIAVKESQYPEGKCPEIAFAGRSNVGKSSLLNLLTGRKKLARTSGSPGKTRTINFYTINDDEFRIVDLPGYGYAKVSKSISAGWGDMIERYLKSRENLIQVVLLVDIRHKPTEQDKQMYQWIKHYGFGGLIVATKGDKVKKSQLAKNLNLIKKTLELDSDAVIITTSTLKKTGIEELKGEIEKSCNDDGYDSTQEKEDKNGKDK